MYSCIYNFFFPFFFFYQSSKDAGDSATLLLLHEGIQDLSSTAVEGQRALGFIHLLPHFPHHFPSLIIHLHQLSQLSLVLQGREEQFKRSSHK